MKFWNHNHCRGYHFSGKGHAKNDCPKMIKIIKIRDTVERLLPRFLYRLSILFKIRNQWNGPNNFTGSNWSKDNRYALLSGISVRNSMGLLELGILQKSFLVRTQRIGPKNIGPSTPISENIMILFISNKLVTPWFALDAITFTDLLWPLLTLNDL